MSVSAFIALGSNVGQREEYLLRAVQLLDQTAGISVDKVSSVYETDPVGYVDQPQFLNMVVQVSTSLEPVQLLAQVKQIEAALGRIRVIRWGPRTIDLDILTYGNQQVQLPHLQIPHPLMAKRAFVLIPLHELWGDEVFPGLNINLDKLILATDDYKGVRKWGSLDWETGSGPSAS